jgi:hypothetical protein
VPSAILAVVTALSVILLVLIFVKAIF